jgi:hypothetical protein
VRSEINLYCRKIEPIEALSFKTPFWVFWDGWTGKLYSKYICKNLYKDNYFVHLDGRAFLITENSLRVFKK